MGGHVSHLHYQPDVLKLFFQHFLKAAIIKHVLEWKKPEVKPFDPNKKRYGEQKLVFRQDGTMSRDI